MEFTVAPQGTTVTYARPGEGEVDPAAREDLLRRSAQQLALVLAIEHWTDATISNMSRAWVETRAGAPLTATWSVTCELFEDNGVAVHDRRVQPADDDQLPLACGRALAFALQTLGAPDVASLAG